MLKIIFRFIAIFLVFIGGVLGGIWVLDMMFGLADTIPWGGVIGGGVGLVMMYVVVEPLVKGWLVPSILARRYQRMLDNAE